MNHKGKDVIAFNYCVSFLDLLGQRQALHGQGLLPTLGSEEEKQAFDQAIKDTIGPIQRLQISAEAMMRAALGPHKNSPFRSSLAPELQREWGEMQRTHVTTQRWSDGLMLYVCLGDTDVKCPVKGTFNVFALAGGLCFIGLASHCPIRGGIDIAWAVELHKGELYGAAVARAYELESECAQYPRIVVGPRVVDYMKAQKANTGQDRFSRFNGALADVCLSMLTLDADGLWFLDYLGETFQRLVSQEQHPVLYRAALDYVTDQAKHHRVSGNTKLATRYSRLERYFGDHSGAA